MAKSPQFMIDLVKRFIAEPNKKVYTAKSGNVKLWKDAGVVRLQHYNHIILEVDLNGEYQADNFQDMITRWHIQSITDANYIGTILGLFHNHNFRLGYRPVNGGGYFETKIGDEWVPVGGEE